MSLRPLLTALIGALIAVAAPATAAVASEPGAGYTALDAPLGVPTELRIDLKGHVAARCDLTTPPAPVSSMALHRAGQRESAFEIDCNAPFTLRVRSSEGGFASVAPTPGVQGLMPYQVSVAVGTDAGRQDLGWCDAADLAPGAVSNCEFAPGAASGGWSSGEETAIDRTGALRLRWDEQDEGAPRLGDYRDVIVIELEVRS